MNFFERFLMGLGIMALAWGCVYGCRDGHWRVPRFHGNELQQQPLDRN